MEQQKCEFSTLRVRPPNLVFEVREGSQFIPGYQYCFVDKDKPGLNARWEATGNKDWLRLVPISDSGTGRIRVGCASVGMAAGVYHAQITVTSHVEVKDPVVQITLTVHPKDAPTPPAPPPDPEPEPPPPEPEPEPPPPEPEPPEPKPPEEKNWFIRFLEWLMEQLEKIWKH